MPVAQCKRLPLAVPSTQRQRRPLAALSIQRRCWPLAALLVCSSLCPLGDVYLHCSHLCSTRKSAIHEAKCNGHCKVINRVCRTLLCKGPVGAADSAALAQDSTPSIAIHAWDMPEGIYSASRGFSCEAGLRTPGCELLLAVALSGMTVRLVHIFRRRHSKRPCAVDDFVRLSIYQNS